MGKYLGTIVFLLVGLWLIGQMWRKPSSGVAEASDKTRQSPEDKVRTLAAQPGAVLVPAAAAASAAAVSGQANARTLVIGQADPGNDALVAIAGAIARNEGSAIKTIQWVDTGSGEARVNSLDLESVKIAAAHLKISIEEYLGRNGFANIQTSNTQDLSGSSATAPVVAVQPAGDILPAASSWRPQGSVQVPKVYTASGYLVVTNPGDVWNALSATQRNRVNSLVGESYATADEAIQDLMQRYRRGEDAVGIGDVLARFA